MRVISDRVSGSGELRCGACCEVVLVYASMEMAMVLPILKIYGPLRFAASGLVTILEQEVGTSAVSFREQMCIY